MHIEVTQETFLDDGGSCIEVKDESLRHLRCVRGGFCQHVFHLCSGESFKCCHSRGDVFQGSIYLLVFLDLTLQKYSG